MKDYFANFDVEDNSDCFVAVHLDLLTLLTMQWNIL